MHVLRTSSIILTLTWLPSLAVATPIPPEVPRPEGLPDYAVSNLASALGLTLDALY